MKFLVMRRPVLMEDEGRETLMGIRDTREEAQALLNNLTGYFRPSDFYIIEGPEEGDQKSGKTTPQR